MASVSMALQAMKTRRSTTFDLEADLVQEEKEEEELQGSIQNLKEKLQQLAAANNISRSEHEENLKRLNLKSRKHNETIMQLRDKIRQLEKALEDGKFCCNFGV